MIKNHKEKKKNKNKNMSELLQQRRPEPMTVQLLYMCVCVCDGNSAEIQLYFITLIANWLKESRIFGARARVREHIEEFHIWFNFNVSPALFTRQSSAVLVVKTCRHLTATKRCTLLMWLGFFVALGTFFIRGIDFFFNLGFFGFFFFISFFWLRDFKEINHEQAIQRSHRAT